MGPRDAAEHPLYELILAGLDSGPGTDYARVADFGIEFRARLTQRKR